MVCISLMYFADISNRQIKAKKLIKYAYFCWFISDVIAAIVEIRARLSWQIPDSFYNIEIALYMISRIFILFSTVELYRVITRKTNKFQRWSDVFTFGMCVLKFYK